MPHRSHSIWLGLLGVFAVLALLLVGADVWLASRSGPRWKRRLVGAGLAFMAFLGFLSWPETERPESKADGASKAVSGTDDPDRTLDDRIVSTRDLLALEYDEDADGEEDADEGGDDPPRAERLANSGTWKKFAGAWKEAREILDRKKELKKPFKKADRDEIVKRISSAGDLLETLVKEDSLTEAEASILRKEFNILVSGLRSLPCVDEILPTCYSPPPVPSSGGKSFPPPTPEPIWPSYNYLKDRLPLIEELASQDGVWPQVLDMVLSGMENRLKHLFAEGGVAKFPEEWQVKIKDLRVRIRALLDEIRRESEGGGRELPGAPALDGQPAWAAVQKAWNEAREIVSRKRGMFPFDEKGKKELLDALAATQGQLDALAEKGLISEAGAELLKREFTLLAGEVGQYRTKGMERATCYKPMAMPSEEQRARMSAKFLSDRVSLLEKLSSLDRVTPGVFEKVLVRIDLHLNTVSELGKALPEEEKTESETLRKKVIALLAKIRARTCK